MRMRAAFIVLAAFASPVFATQPGQPLDCSDFTFSEPGHSCTLVRSCQGGSCEFPTDSGLKHVFDNQGRSLEMRGTYLGPCAGASITRLEIGSFLGAEFHPVAVLQTRCNGPGMWDHANLDALSFDAVNGRLLVSVRSTTCRAPGYPECTPETTPWFAQIDGFATLFEILQSYAPSSGKLGFRVPQMPAGLPAADDFDTYWGLLSDLPDFTQAQPMACDYPTDHHPESGEYLTVADTSPTPSPGNGNYIVTAVTKGMQRRYGRKLIGGVLSGRDPAMLPECR